LRRHRKSGLAAAGSCLAVYVVLAVAFHWLIKPVVGKNYGPAAYLPPETFAARFDALPEAPARAAFASPVSSPLAPEPAIATAVKAPAPDTAAAPKKAPKKHVARARPPRPQEQPIKAQQNPGSPWDFASRGLFGNRPWF
jgi:hypothetical protein